MSIIEQAIRDHEDRCNDSLPKRYVPWQWMIGILLTIALTIGGSAWALSSQFTSVKKEAELATKKNDEQDLKITRLERMDENIQWMRENWSKK